jgi:hypothetical protein
MKGIKSDMSPQERLLWMIFYYQPGVPMKWPLGVIPRENVSGLGPLKTRLFLLLSDHHFTDREVRVICTRYGFHSHDHELLTYEATGKIFDVTRERIRQIEGKVLRKLRHPTRKRYLRPYVQVLADPEQGICDEWNAKYPIGTKVIYTDCHGKKYEGTTGERAKVVYSKAVVWLSEPDLAARYELNQMEVIAF